MQTYMGDKYTVREIDRRQIDETYMDIDNLLNC